MCSRSPFVPGHDRGRVLVDVATMIAAGGEAIADIDTLRHQEQVLGAVASAPTVWRALDESTPAVPEADRDCPGNTRARVRSLIPGGVPASAVAGTVLPADLVVLDVDATIVPVHSKKEGATRTFNKTFGYHPIGVWCDNTQELLAATLRPGNAGSNTTNDQIGVLTAAILQTPPRIAASCWSGPAPPTACWGQGEPTEALTGVHGAALLPGAGAKDQQQWPRPSRHPNHQGHGNPAEPRDQPAQARRLDQHRARAATSRRRQPPPPRAPHNVISDFAEALTQDLIQDEAKGDPRSGSPATAI